MKYFSLFSGIGGFELGIQQAYVEMFNREKDRGGKENSQKDDEAYQRLESETGEKIDASLRRLSKLSNGFNDKGTPTCVGYSEIDKYATQIYSQHFPEHKNYGDITKINAEELPDFDLLVGGFPCQAFSIAGKRKGFEDTRGTLFFDIARIIERKRPQRILLENVKGLLSHDNGKTFRTIIATIDELGYDIQWQVLNSKNHGVPQNRERVYIVGHLRGTSRPEVFPFTESSQSNLQQIIGGGQGNRIYSQEGISTTLASQAGGQGAKTGLYAVTSKKDLKRGFVKTEILGTLIARYYSGILGDGRPAVSDGVNVRRLTPKECERLQGFPDNWTAGTSDTQRYKCLGNAVTVNVIREIIKRLYEKEYSSNT